MRPTAYGLMALGVIVSASSLVVLVAHGLQSFLGHREGVPVTLLFAGVTYMGVLVRRRANVIKDRQPM